MERLVISVVEYFGYFGIFFLIFIENVIPPIPSEIILALAGFFTVSSGLRLEFVILSSTLGSMAGAMLLYYIGYKLRDKRIHDYLNNKESIFLISHDDIKKGLDFYRKHENPSVFFGRMVPVIRSLISIPAGMEKMEIKKFLVFTGLGSLIWNSVISSVGAYLGANWRLVVNVVDTYAYGVYFLIIVGIIYFIYRRKVGKK